VRHRRCHLCNRCCRQC